MLTPEREKQIDLYLQDPRNSTLNETIAIREMRAELGRVRAERDSQREYATLANQKWLAEVKKLDVAVEALDLCVRFGNALHVSKVAREALAKIKKPTDWFSAAVQETEKYLATKKDDAR